MASATRLRKRPWCWSTGERRKNRVRVYEDQTRGTIFLDFYESDADGKSIRRRKSLGTMDRERAKQQAENLASDFRRAGRETRRVLDLASLFDIYRAERSPAKSAGSLSFDARTAALFVRAFGGGRDVQTLSRADWDGFIERRRRGALRHPGSRSSGVVGDRQIEYDLRFLQAVLNWALVSRGPSGPLLERNPLRGMPIPRERNPMRPVITDDELAALRREAVAMPPLFDLALVVAHETGHRISAILHLRWSDIDAAKGRVQWRASFDKIGFEHSTIASSELMEALEQERRRSMTVGDGWIFPSPRRAGEPCSRHLLRDWFQRAAARANLPQGQRIGWHALRRHFATEMKDTPLKDLCYMGGWKSPQTVLQCYQQPDESTMLTALANRRSLTRRAAG
jgi:integrase